MLDESEEERCKAITRTETTEECRTTTEEVAALEEAMMTLFLTASFQVCKTEVQYVCDEVEQQQQPTVQTPLQSRTLLPCILHAKVENSVFQIVLFLSLLYNYKPVPLPPFPMSVFPSEAPLAHCFCPKN